MFYTMHAGIILAQTNTRSMVLDQNLGRIYCLPKNPQYNKNIPLIASQIHYTIVPARISDTHYQIDFQELIAIPHYHSVQHMLFVHHVIELCIHSLPFGAAAPDIFSLLIQLSCPRLSIALTTRSVQTIFLVRILMILGLMLERNPLCVQDIEIIFNQPLESTTELSHDLIEWCIHSIQTHPSYSLFKTNHFLDTLLT